MVCTVQLPYFSAIALRGYFESIIKFIIKSCEFSLWAKRNPKRKKKNLGVGDGDDGPDGRRQMQCMTFSGTSLKPEKRGWEDSIGVCSKSGCRNRSKFYQFLQGARWIYLLIAFKDSFAMTLSLWWVLSTNLFLFIAKEQYVPRSKESTSTWILLRSRFVRLRWRLKWRMHLGSGVLLFLAWEGLRFSLQWRLKDLFCIPWSLLPRG